MGKPTKAKTGGSGTPGLPSASGSNGDASDAVSLHTVNEPYHDDSDDEDAALLSGPGVAHDLPPSYTETSSTEPYSDNVPGGSILSRVINIVPGPGAPRPPRLNDAHPPVQPFASDSKTGNESFMSNEFNDPKLLEQQIRTLAAIPPRPFIKIVGSHSQTQRDSKGKTEKKTIIDFDIGVDLTPYLYRDAQFFDSWSCMHTVENCEKARRGTVLRKRAPGYKADLEVGGPDKPTLKEWCHLYGASSASLKCFSMRREVSGFRMAWMREQLTSLIRGTNYRGNLSIHLETKGQLVECYNDTKVNRWRLTTWIWWLFALTFLWIFTWPYLFFATKRWEVVKVDWPYSRINESNDNVEYVSLTEEELYNMWARAIAKAALQKRQDTLSQADLVRSQEPDPNFELDSGSRTMDNLFRAGIGAMNEVNRQLGWGGDC